MDLERRIGLHLAATTVLDGFTAGRIAFDIVKMLPHAALAPAVADIGLPELRDHLATAKVMDRSITLSPASAGALHLAMTTAPAQPEPGAAPQLAGYVEPQEIPCIGQCRTTLWATKQSADAQAVYLPPTMAPKKEGGL
ncbi:hypothetical protein ASF61_06680 [Duganella sp. Leaf126]|nr:hypothetical protein ASF61_06680 [Duganella sp. Leaf126]